MKQEPIAKALEIAGSPLYFPYYMDSLPVVLGFDIYTSELSPHGNRQEERYFSCMASAEQTAILGIKAGDSCSLSDFFTELTFTIQDIISELENWVTITLIFKDRCDV